MAKKQPKPKSRKRRVRDEPRKDPNQAAFDLVRNLGK